MAVNLDDLDPNSQEFEDAIDAAQAEEDAARGNVEREPDEADEDAPTKEGAAADETAETTAEAADDVPAEPETPAKVAGVASKDGSRVLPYAALQSARQEARQAKAERDEARQLIADLKAGKTAEAEPDPFSDEAIAELAADLPIVGEMSKAMRQMREEIAQLKVSKEPEKQPQSAVHPQDALQEDIDSVPLLAEWQAVDAEKFERAKEIDRALINSPKWRSRPQVERFDHVARMVADEYDIQVPSKAPPKPTPPNKARANPQEVISNTRRSAPNTLSDFKGGAFDTGQGDLSKMPPARAMARMAQMTDAEIDAHLAKFG